MLAFWAAGVAHSVAGVTGRLVDFTFFEISENLLHVSFLQIFQGKKDLKRGNAKGRVHRRLGGPDYASILGPSRMGLIASLGTFFFSCWIPGPSGAHKVSVQ